MLEHIGAAFTITQPCGNITGTKGCERAGTVMGQSAGSAGARTSWADGATRAVCRAWGLLHWAAKLGPTNHHRHTQVLSTAPQPHRRLCLHPSDARALGYTANWYWGRQQGSSLVRCSAHAQLVCWVQLRQKSCLSGIVAALPPCPVHPASPAQPTPECQRWDVHGGLITTHFSPKYRAVFVRGEPYHPSSSGAQKGEGFQWAHSRQTAASFTHPGMSGNIYKPPGTQNEPVLKEGSGPYIV